MKKPSQREDVCKTFVCLGINGRFYAATFTYPHLTHKVLSLSSADLPDVPFSRNLIPMLYTGLLYLTEKCSSCKIHSDYKLSVKVYKRIPH
jgi:hypothetical protein